MNYDFSGFHPGHKVSLVTRAGSVLVVCMDCQVAADLEAVAGKISAADSLLVANKDRTLIGKMSAGIPWAGQVKK